MAVRQPPEASADKHQEGGGDDGGARGEGGGGEGVVAVVAEEVWADGCEERHGKQYGEKQRRFHKNLATKHTAVSVARNSLCALCALWLACAFVNLCNPLHIKHRLTAHPVPKVLEKHFR